MKVVLIFMNNLNNINNSIIKYILDLIKNGTCTVNNCIPSENSLAELFGVPRSTVRESLKALQYIGILKSTKGLGYSVNNAMEEPLSLLAKLLLSTKKYTYKDISEIREALEIKAYLLIKKREIKKDDIDFLNQCIDNMLKRIDTVDADIKFHQKIAQLSNNNLIITITKLLSEISKQYITVPWDNIDDQELHELTNIHKSIVNSLVNQENNSGNVILPNPISKHYCKTDSIIAKYEELDAHVSLPSFSKNLKSAGFSSVEIDKILKIARQEDIKLC